LSESGVKDIIILEARDEIGGRMMTHDFGGITIEKGANWIEGVNGPNVNPIIPIAKEIGLVNDRSNFDNITNNIYGAEYEAFPLTPGINATYFLWYVSWLCCVANERMVMLSIVRVSVEKFLRRKQSRHASSSRSFTNPPRAWASL
jgi:monoamine oxidase